MYILHFNIILLLIISINFGYSKAVVPCLGDIKTGKPIYILSGQNSVVSTRNFLAGNTEHLHYLLTFKVCREENNVFKYFDPPYFIKNINFERFLKNNEGAEADIKKFLSDNPDYLDSMSYLALVLNTEAKEFEDENGTKYYEVNFEIGRKKTRYQRFTSIYQEKKIYRFYFYEMEIGRSDEEIKAANERETKILNKRQSRNSIAKDFIKNIETIQHRNKRLYDQRMYSQKKTLEEQEKININQSTNDEEGSPEKKIKIIDTIEHSKIEEANYVSSGRFKQELEKNPEVNRETMEVLNLLIHLL